jgi:hypothetical protein
VGRLNNSTARRNESIGVICSPLYPSSLELYVCLIGCVKFVCQRQSRNYLERE